MLDTVTWPTKRPATSMARGYAVPCRAARRSRRTSARNVVGRRSPPGGTVASHGRSQAALRWRAARHPAASAADSGRTVTSPERRGTGHAPGDRPVITAHRLLDGVLEDRPEHLDGVLHPAARAREVDDQALTGEAGQAARQHRGRHALRHARGPDRLGDAGDLAVEQRPGRLRRQVRGRQPGATGRQHHPRAGPDEAADRGADRRAVLHPRRLADEEAEVGEERRQQWSGGVLVDPGRGTVGGDDDARRQVVIHRCHSPDLPPVFDSTRTSVITAPLSTAFTMSTTARAATETAVSASISTPVRSAVRTVAVISTASSATVRSTVTPEMASGWHSGMSDGVCLAPMMPAMRATASASPFGTPPPRSSPTTSSDTSTRPLAVAVRAVTSLPVTSTIRAAPDSSRWVRSDIT